MHVLVRPPGVVGRCWLSPRDEELGSAVARATTTVQGSWFSNGRRRTSNRCRGLSRKPNPCNRYATRVPWQDGESVSYPMRVELLVSADSVEKVVVDAEC
jgi:hypothetical protein